MKTYNVDVLKAIAAISTVVAEHGQRLYSEERDTLLAAITILDHARKWQ